MNARNADQWRALPAIEPQNYVVGDVYTGPVVFEAQRERIFAHTWRIAGHVSELAKPLDYRRYDHLGCR